MARTGVPSGAGARRETSDQGCSHRIPCRQAGMLPEDRTPRIPVAGRVCEGSHTASPRRTAAVHRDGIPYCLRGTHLPRVRTDPRKRHALRPPTARSVAGTRWDGCIPRGPCTTDPQQAALPPGSDRAGIASTKSPRMSEPGALRGAPVFPGISLSADFGHSPGKGNRIETFVHGSRGLTMTPTALAAKDRRRPLFVCSSLSG